MVLLEEFQRILLCSGGRAVGFRHYGVWDRYPFSAQISQVNEPGVASFEFRLNASLESGYLKELKKSLPRGCQLTAAKGFIYRLVCSGCSLRECGLSLGSILSALAQTFQSAGIPPSDVCPLCGRTGCDAYAGVGGYTAVHRVCVENMVENAGVRTGNLPLSGSYAAGFIGALLGGLGAYAPTLLAYRAGWVAVHLGVLIPLCAWLGYRLLRGRMGRGTFACVCAASIPHLFTIQELYVYFLSRVSYSVWPRLFNEFPFRWTSLSQAKATAYVLSSSFRITVAIMAPVLWILWLHIRRTVRAGIDAGITVRSTLMNRNPFVY